jgi:hypothetical protein
VAFLTSCYVKILMFIYLSFFLFAFGSVVNIDCIIPIKKVNKRAGLFISFIFVCPVFHIYYAI